MSPTLIRLIPAFSLTIIKEQLVIGSKIFKLTSSSFLRLIALTPEALTPIMDISCSEYIAP